MSYNYRPMYFGAISKLMFTEKTDVIWRVTLGAGLINVLLNLMLIPFYGFEVAAVTTFVAYMFMGYTGYYFKVFKEINTAKYYPVFWILLTIALTVFAYYAVELSLWIKIMISIALTTIALLFIYRINKLLNEN